MAKKKMPTAVKKRPVAVNVSSWSEVEIEFANRCIEAFRKIDSHRVRNEELAPGVRYVVTNEFKFDWATVSIYTHGIRGE